MCLGNLSRSIRSIAIDLLTLLEMCLMWAFQFSWLSTMTPRNLVSDISVIILLSMWIDIDSGLCLLVINLFFVS